MVLTRCDGMELTCLTRESISLTLRLSLVTVKHGDSRMIQVVIHT